MSWPVGYGVSKARYSTAPDGTIVADGVALTSAGGWIELPASPELQDAGAVGSYALRLQVSVDAEGRAFFYAKEVELGGVRFTGLFALAKARGDAWLSVPVHAARAALEARRLAGLAARAGVRNSRAMPELQPTHGTAAVQRPRTNLRSRLSSDTLPEFTKPTQH